MWSIIHNQSLNFQVIFTHNLGSWHMSSLAYKKTLTLNHVKFKIMIFFNKTSALSTSGKQGHSGIGKAFQIPHHPGLTEDSDGA